MRGRVMHRWKGSLCRLWLSEALYLTHSLLTRAEQNLLQPTIRDVSNFFLAHRCYPSFLWCHSIQNQLDTVDFTTISASFFDRSSLYFMIR